MTWNPDWSRQYSQVYNIPQPQVSFGNVNMAPGVTIPEPQSPPTSMPVPQPDVGVTQPAVTQPVSQPTQVENPYADPMPEFKPGFRLINPAPQVPAQDVGSPVQNEVPIVEQPSPVYTQPPVSTPQPQPVVSPAVPAPSTVPNVVNPIVSGGGYQNMQMQTMAGDQGLSDGSNMADPYGAEVPQIRTVNTSAAGDNLVRAEDQEIDGIKINRYFGSQMR